MASSIAGRQRVAGTRRFADEDRFAIGAHLLRLSDRDRQMRFCRAVSDAAAAAYVERIDFEKSVFVGYFDESDLLIALAEGFPYVDRAVRTLEVAFSTDELWRRQGLARLLLVEVTDFACDRCIDQVVAQCLVANRQMRALLGAVGAVCHIDDGEVVGELQLVAHTAR